jgi:hypothetical protein
MTWFSVSAVVVFMVAVSLFLTAKAGNECVNTVDSAARISAENTDVYIKSLKGGFNALMKTTASLPEKERFEFVRLYCANRTDIEHFIFSNPSDRAEKYSSYEGGIDSSVFENFNEGEVYAFGYKDAPAKQFGLAIKGSFPDTGERLEVIFTNTAINSIMESLEFPADGRIQLGDFTGRLITSGELRAELISDTVNEPEYGYSAIIPESGDLSGEVSSGWSAGAICDKDAAAKLASDSLKGLLNATIILCIIGFIISFVTIIRIGKLRRAGK